MERNIRSLSMVAYSLPLNDFVLKLSIFCDIHEEGLEQSSLEISKTVFHAVEPYFDDVVWIDIEEFKIKSRVYKVWYFWILFVGIEWFCLMFIDISWYFRGGGGFVETRVSSDIPITRGGRLVKSRVQRVERFRRYYWFINNELLLIENLNRIVNCYDY